MHPIGICDDCRGDWDRGSGFYFCPKGFVIGVYRQGRWMYYLSLSNPNTVYFLTYLEEKPRLSYDVSKDPHWARASKALQEMCSNKNFFISMSLVLL